MLNKCKTCKKYKSLNNFYKHQETKDGLVKNCKKCENKRVIKWQKENPKKVKKILNKYRKMNRELCLLRTKNWRKRNKKKLLEYNRNIAKTKYGHKRLLAMWKVKYYIQKGYIKRKPCKICGSKKSHAHHPNYSKPLKVIFLCPLHHKRIHTII